jgi:nucleoside-diphosphate-sugar epimerase
MSKGQSGQIDAYRAVNVDGTGNLAECAVRAGVKRLVFLSSIKVNGEENTTAYSEQCPPSPEDAYGVSKMEAERVIKEVADGSVMETVILRPPLVYGPGVKANFLALMRLVSQKIPLPLSGVKNQRSFIYLGNLVDCIQCCMAHPSAAGQTYLVSDDHDLSTPKLIRLLASAMNKSAFLFPFPVGILIILASLAGKTDALKRLLGSLTVDISKIKKDLSWKPPISTKSGIVRTVKWFEGKRGL